MPSAVFAVKAEKGTLKFNDKFSNFLEQRTSFCFELGRIASNPKQTILPDRGRDNREGGRSAPINSA